MVYLRDKYWDHYYSKQEAMLVQIPPMHSTLFIIYIDNLDYGVKIQLSTFAGDLVSSNSLDFRDS